MSEQRRAAATRPVQFRFPVWAQEFLLDESESRGVTRTDIVLEALADYKHKRLETHLEAGYRACAADTLSEVRQWDGTLLDGLEEEW